MSVCAVQAAQRAQRSTGLRSCCVEEVQVCMGSTLAFEMPAFAGAAAAAAAAAAPLLLPPLLLLPLLLLPLLLLPLLLLLQHLPPPVPLLLPLPLPAMLPVLCAASEAQLPCILRRSQMLCSWTLLIDTSRPRPLPSEVKQGLGHIQAGGEDVHGHHRSGKASNRNTAHTSQRAPFQLAAGITPCFTAKAWSQAASTRV